MIIDVHAHAFPESMAERAIRFLEEKTGNRVRAIGDGTLKGLVGQLAAGGIDHAVFCPIATKPHHFEGILAESLAIRAGERGVEAADRIIPLASVHPDDEQRFAHLARVRESGLKGVKLHPYYQPCVIDSEPMLEYFRCCRDLGLVVQCHCGFDIGFPFDPVCGADRVANVIRQVPGLKLIAAHLGCCFQWDLSVERLLGEDVYLDTSIIPGYETDPAVRRILREHPAERLLFATDWPWLGYPDALRQIRALDRPEDDIRKILGGNAAVLFL